MKYRLSRKAEGDVIDIYNYTAEKFGLTQADSYHQKLKGVFQLLSDQPYIARERTEIAPPVRVHPFGSHLVIYITPSNEDIMILRIRHAHEDWITDHESVES